MTKINLARPSRKGEPPLPEEAVQNLVKPALGEKVPLQLKLNPDTRKDFKTYALAHDRDANDLFEEVWKFYKEKHG